MNATELIEAGRNQHEPVFSLCIPQYNRTSHFLIAIQSFAEQRFRGFEVCVSDGGSTDGRENEILAALGETGLPFAFRRSAVNLKYDINTRMAISMARGRYCILMGNDDALNGPDALAELWEDLQKFGFPGVIISDYCDYRTGTRAYRIRRSELCGAGPRVAALHYRNFSFVSGVTLERAPSQALATSRWDGAEMYQTFIGCRLIAEGKLLLERESRLVRKDIVVSGEEVDAVTRRARIWPCPIRVRTTTLTQMPALVADAIAPHAGSAACRLNEAILLQHLSITVPFWLMEWRRVQSWQYAVGVALGVKPSLSARGISLGTLRYARVWVVYFSAALAGLVIPQWLFARCRGWLYRLAKSIR